MLLAPRRALAAVIAVLIAVVAATASALSVPAVASSTAASAAPTERSAATAPAKPGVGTCHDLTYDQAYADSDPAPAVPCRRTHTLRTFLVPTVPDRIDMDDDEALEALVTRRCSPALLRVVSGGSLERRLMSAYSYFWFTPTRAQVRAGARWVRCDLALLAGLDGITTLPRASRPQLQGRPPYDDRVARCYTGRQPGGYHYVTACSRKHQYRARKVYDLGGPKGRAYPGRQGFERIGERRCAPVTGRRWHQFVPDEEQWLGDYRYVVCTTRTTR